MKTLLAPRLTASSPTVPTPANRSRTVAPSNQPRSRLNTDSLTREAYGRDDASSLGESNMRDRNSPAVILSMLQASYPRWSQKVTVEDIRKPAAYSFNYDRSA